MVDVLDLNLWLLWSRLWRFAESFGSLSAEYAAERGVVRRLTFLLACFGEDGLQIASKAGESRLACEDPERGSVRPCESAVYVRGLNSISDVGRLEIYMADRRR